MRHVGKFTLKGGLALSLAGVYYAAAFYRGGDQESHADMARITVEDCLDNVENRFELVMLASKRARQLATGGRDPLVEDESDKATVIALREIADGLITPEILARESEIEAEEELAATFETPIL